MKATMHIENPDEVMVTLTVTMTNGQWEAIARGLQTAPDMTSTMLRQAIRTATGRVQAEIMADCTVKEDQ